MPGSTWDMAAFARASTALPGVSQQAQLALEAAGLNAFDQTISAITDGDLQVAWQSMLQQQHQHQRQLQHDLLQQQRQQQQPNAMTAPFFTSGNTFSPFGPQPSLSFLSWMADAAVSCSSSSSATSGSTTATSTANSSPQLSIQHLLKLPQGAGQAQRVVVAPDAKTGSAKIADPLELLQVEDPTQATMFLNSFRSAASAASDHYGSDPREDSDTAASGRLPAAVTARPSKKAHSSTSSMGSSTSTSSSAVAAAAVGTTSAAAAVAAGAPPADRDGMYLSYSPHGSTCSGEDDDDDCGDAAEFDAITGKRKRKPYWRQKWYKERNKEYSRNWRSKKKMEEETLRSEIAELRAYRKLVEDALDMHVHDADSAASGFPFTYVSQGLLRVLGVDSAAVVLGKGLVELVHPEDRARVREAMAKVAAGGRADDITYRFITPGGGAGAERTLVSTLRKSDKGVLAVTRAKEGGK